MKWRYTPRPAFDYSVWHKWFAWKPIIVGDYKLWLCFVSRRGKFPPDTSLYQQNFLVRFTTEVRWEYEELIYYY